MDLPETDKVYNYYVTNLVKKAIIESFPCLLIRCDIKEILVVQNDGKKVTLSTYI